MTLIPGKGVKTLQMYRWNPAGIPSIAGAEQGLETDAAPVGQEVRLMLPTALGAHTNQSSPHHLSLIAEHGFIGCFFFSSFCASLI